MNDLHKAREILKSNNAHTCVLCKGDSTIASSKPGISPMLDIIDQGIDVAGYAVADKIVGKAAAMLFVLAKVASAHAVVLGKTALDYLKDNNIPCTYDTLADYIVNRTNTGPCPMEETVRDIDDPKTAFHKLLQKRNQLRDQSKRIEPQVAKP
ncbi:MAG: DUF1893 domain-containing protein [Lentisphaerae bacterium]|jgi:hypothetical protein|nr:DUF1893 domain-containing protein [Lentisphaerota bacterium]